MRYEIEVIGNFHMINIIGNIDSESKMKKLDDEISKIMDAGNHHFVFNLERTTFLDSAGISIFIHCLCDVQEHNGSIYLIAEDSQVRNVLEMVGLTRLIKTYNSRNDFVQDHIVSVNKR